MWSTSGVVTGGQYGDSESCQPYFLAPCNHHSSASASSRPKCVAQETTPSCSESCTHGRTYQADKSFGESAYAVASSEDAIMEEIRTNGPIVAGFMVYADFPHYKVRLRAQI